MIDYPLVSRYLLWILGYVSKTWNVLPTNLFIDSPYIAILAPQSKRTATGIASSQRLQTHHT